MVSTAPWSRDKSKKMSCDEGVMKLERQRTRGVRATYTTSINQAARTNLFPSLPLPSRPDLLPSRGDHGQPSFSQAYHMQITNYNLARTNRPLLQVLGSYSLPSKLRIGWQDALLRWEWLFDLSFSLFFGSDQAVIGRGKQTQILCMC